jgi:hypothetical protein
LPSPPRPQGGGSTPWLRKAPALTQPGTASNEPTCPPVSSGSVRVLLLCGLMCLQFLCWGAQCGTYYPCGFSDRTIPSVNLWTAVPSYEVVIGSQPRTCDATNRASDLRIYLDFDTPVSSSVEDLLRLLSVSDGVLTPTARKSLGNRRFGFRVSFSKCPCGFKVEVSFG